MHVQLAFLASIVSPKVASAAAQRALDVLASEDIITADLDDYLPKEETSNGSAEQAASLSPPAASESASKAPAESKPASVAALPDGEVKAVEHEEEKAKAGEAVKAEVVQQHDSIAASASCLCKWCDSCAYFCRFPCELRPYSFLLSCTLRLTWYHLCARDSDCACLFPMCS